MPAPDKSVCLRGDVVWLVCYLLILGAGRVLPYSTFPSSSNQYFPKAKLCKGEAKTTAATTKWPLFKRSFHLKMRCSALYWFRRALYILRILAFDLHDTNHICLLKFVTCLSLCLWYICAFYSNQKTFMYASIQVSSGYLRRSSPMSTDHSPPHPTHLNS